MNLKYIKYLVVIKNLFILIGEFLNLLIFDEKTDQMLCV